MRRLPRALVTLFLLSLLLLIPGAGAADMTLAAGGQASSPADVLADAWQRARDAGSYRFLSTVDETLIPRPIPDMIGQGDTRVVMENDGAVVLPDQGYMELRVANGSGQGESVTLLRDGGEAFMVRDGEVTPVQDPLSLAAPANDFLGFLGAAEGVQALGAPEGHPELSRYGFDLSGARFEAYVRAQAQAALQADPDAPDGLTIQPSSALRDMSGQGELWVDADGLPVRQVLDVTWPQVNDSYSVQLHMVVDLSGYGSVESLPQAVQQPDGSWRLEGQTTETSEVLGGETPPLHLPVQVPPSLVVAFALALLATIFLRYYRRQPKRAYALMACVMVLLLAGSPLLQSGRVVRFAERQASAAEAQSATTPDLIKALGMGAQPTQDIPEATPTEVSAEPAATPTTEQPVATVAAAPPMPVIAASGAEPRAVGSYQAAGTESDELITRCGDATEGVDTDGDGLSDQYEACYGTNPYSPDSDGDGLTDSQELEGFWWNDRQWHSDPLNVDTNSDGIPDTLEWSQMEAPGVGQRSIADIDWDGIPNIWDDDDDGDGVPDRIDLSPFAHKHAAHGAARV